MADSVVVFDTSGGPFRCGAGCGCSVAGDSSGGLVGGGNRDCSRSLRRVAAGGVEVASDCLGRPLPRFVVVCG